MNVEGVLRHVLDDVPGLVGAIIAAGTIIFTGWRYADPLITVLIGILVLGSSRKLLTRIIHKASE